MSFIGEWLRRLAYLINRGRIERDLQKEMETHRQLMGDPVRFGNSLRLREEAQDVWGWNWLDALSRDLLYASRSLRRSPGFTLAAILILGAGIGVNLGFFHIVNVTLFRPLPVRDPNGLVRFDRIWRTSTNESISSATPYPGVDFLRHNNTALSAVLTQIDNEIVFGDDSTDRIRGSFVSANWFQELGCNALYGRLFDEKQEEAADAPPVVVLGENFWSNRFGRASDAIGRSIRINGRPALVIGIVPSNFPGLKLLQQEVKVWLPMNQIDYFVPGTKFKTDWSAGGAEFYARLRSGIGLAAARDSLRAPMAELAVQHPVQFNQGEWLEPYSGSVYFERPAEHAVRWRVTALAGALFLLVLLIACANLSSVVLSRSMNKVRELSLRAALGAGRARIIVQILAESVWIGGIGTAVGLFFSYWALKLFVVQTEAPPSWFQLTPDWHLALACLLLSVFSVAVVGLIPAWRITRRRDALMEAIKDGGQQASAALNRTRLRQVMIAVQIAASSILLVAAGVLVRQFERVMADPGYDFKSVAVLNPRLDRFGVGNDEARGYWSDLKAALKSVPEVESLSLVSLPPLGNSLVTSSFEGARDVEVTIERVEPDFFTTMKIPILGGRVFDSSDDYRSSVIISRHLALRMYGTIDVIGMGFPKAKPENTIVGVAADARLVRLERFNDAEAYYPLHPEPHGSAGQPCYDTGLRESDSRSPRHGDSCRRPGGSGCRARLSWHLRFVVLRGQPEDQGDRNPHRSWRKASFHRFARNFAPVVAGIRRDVHRCCRGRGRVAHHGE
jgi:macrolide transport system ATP-binding/permease protein